MKHTPVICGAKGCLMCYSCKYWGRINKSKWGQCLMAVFFFLNIFVPTTKEYLAIKSISYVTQNEKVLTTGDKFFEAMDKYLDEYLDEKEVNENHN